MRDGVTERADYMATVRAARVQGDTALFDSEHRHQHYITLTIARAERERCLSHDWIYGRDELIEVAMSEAQWAAMISSLNFGSGVPATVQHIQGQRVEQPEVDDRTSLYKDEMVKTMETAVARLQTMKEGKLTKAVQREIDMVIQEIRSNMPYVEKCFDEHMETRVEKAKGDIEAAMNAAVQRAGLAALAVQDSPLVQIEDQTDA